MILDDDDQQAQAIADEWGIDVEDLDKASWDVEEIQGNDGEIYGYLVRFAPDTDPLLLQELGLSPGEVTREVSASAFETDDDDRRDDDGDGIFSLDEPFPDMFSSDGEDAGAELQSPSPTTAYLVAEDSSLITDEAGNRLIVEGLGVADDVDDPVSSARDELLWRLDGVEEALRQLRQDRPARLHNNPPEPVENGPLSQRDIESISVAISALRKEAQEKTPKTVILEVQSQVLRKIAYSVTVWIARKLDMTVDTLIKWGIPAGAAAVVARNPELVAQALNATADAAVKLSRFLGGG